MSNKSGGVVGSDKCKMQSNFCMMRRRRRRMQQLTMPWDDVKWPDHKPQFISRYNFYCIYIIYIYIYLPYACSYMTNKYLFCLPFLSQLTSSSTDESEVDIISDFISFHINNDFSQVADMSQGIIFQNNLMISTMKVFVFY